MEALHDVVRAGKARYLGASSMYAWQFAKAQHVAERHGWTPFVSMQNHYNLIYREEEREMLPLCADQGVGVIPWSPLARGRLTRPWDTADRALRDRRVRPARSTATRTARSWSKVLAVAERRGVAPAQVALAWLLAQPAVTSPIVGRHQAGAPVRRGRRGRPRARRRRDRGARRGLRAARDRGPPLRRVHPSEIPPRTPATFCYRAARM